MASANSLAGLRKFLGRDEWREAFNEMVDRHLLPACAKADVSIDELLEVIGEHHTTVLGAAYSKTF